MSRSMHADGWNGSNEARRQARRFAHARKLTNGLQQIWSPTVWRDVFVDADGALTEVRAFVQRGRKPSRRTV